MSHHILTTGISLYQNFANSKQTTLADALRRHKEVKQELFKNAEKASAEINSLNKRTNFLNSTPSDLSVTFIHTENEIGKSVASLLEKFMKDRRIRVEKIPVKGFDKPAGDASPEYAQQFATEALAQMRERVVEHVAKLRRNSQAGEIELNCTGGYKAEVAVLYELGRALRLPVYYLHETFKVCVTLP